MADCIPFATWTATASEISSLAVVWTLANASMDRKRRVSSEVLKVTNSNNPLGFDRQKTRRQHNHCWRRQDSVLGIARAGAEIPHSITFDLDTRHNGFNRVSQLKHLPTTGTRMIMRASGTTKSGRLRRSTLQIMKRCMKAFVKEIRETVSIIQHVFRHCLNAVWTLGKVLFPFFWLAYATSPQSAFLFSRATKLAISSTISIPIVSNIIVQTLDPKLKIHHFIRDSGLFRVLMDTLVMIGLPGLACKHPSAMVDFFRLGAHRTRIQYGQESKRQIMDMYLPSPTAKLRGLVFFVHGGVWASGSPNLYTGVAKPFLERGMAVAVVGYRTYPEADALTQVQDLELAASVLSQQYPKVCLEESELGVCLLGHSSGSHVLALMLVERLRQHLESDGNNNNNKEMRIDSFIGICGPYDIAKHFQFEAARGVEQLSPMQPACGGKALFHRYSPSLQLKHLLANCTKDEVAALDKAFPHVVFVHGHIDDTVPTESSQDAARVLLSAGVTKCDEIYLPKTGHADAVIDLVVGGPTQNAVLEWMEAQSESTAMAKPPAELQQSMEEIFASAKTDYIALT